MIDIRVMERCPYPGGRFVADGPYSGEFFRDEVLDPALRAAIKQREKIRVVLDGAPGYGSSFLEEAFGGLLRVRKDLSLAEIERTLEIKASDPELLPFVRLAHEYMRHEARRRPAGA